MSFKEFEIKKVIGLEDEVKDFEVNYYSPFCLVLEDLNGEQIQILMDYDTLLNLGYLLKPYLDSEKARYEADENYLNHLKVVR